jgi:hypothetical protein
MLQVPQREPPARRLLRALSGAVARAERWLLDAGAAVLRGVAGLFAAMRRGSGSGVGTTRAGIPRTRPAGGVQGPSFQPAPPDPEPESAPISPPPDLLEGTAAGALVERSSPAGPREPGATRPPSEPEPVLLGGSAPRRARPGDVVLVQFAAYVARFEDQARRALEREAAPGEVRLGEETDCRWAVGARVTVTCTVRGLAVPVATQAFVWDGECRTVSFDVEVPADAQPHDAVIVLEAFVHDAADAPDAVQVGRLRMALEIGGDTDDEPPRRVQGQAARTAFASYASEDRIDVLERVSSIRRSAGLEVFVDVVSLRMGEDWEKRLREQIASSDRFLLFWSEHAAGKKWVTWEWEQALDARGEDALELHLLRATPIDTIPDRLRRFHFDDVYLRAIDAERYRRAHTPPGPDA